MAGESSVVVSVKSAAIPPQNEVRWTWRAMVDSIHGYVDKRGYADEGAAWAAADAWATLHFPNHQIVHSTG